MVILGSEKKVMGFGDVKFSVRIGIVIGYSGEIKEVLYFLDIAFILGALTGIFLILLRKKVLKQELPFAHLCFFLGM